MNRKETGIYPTVGSPAAGPGTDPCRCRSCAHATLRGEMRLAAVVHCAGGDGGDGDPLQRGEVQRSHGDVEGPAVVPCLLHPPSQS